MKKTEKYRYGRKTAALALLTGLALAAFYLEALLPPLPLPGAKLGLANAFSLFALVVYGLPEALIVVIARTVLGSLFAGNFSLLLYSLPAGVLSAVLARGLLLLRPRVSLVCVSVSSAVLHNLVQLTIYCLLTQTALLLSYAPYLCLIGAGAGLGVGAAVAAIVKTLPASAYRGMGKKEELS